MKAVVTAPDERRGENLLRVLKLRQRLVGLRYAPSLDELAREMGVCRRTVRRDLAALEEAHEHVPAWRQDDTP